MVVNVDEDIIVERGEEKKEEKERIGLIINKIVV